MDFISLSNIGSIGLASTGLTGNDLARGFFEHALEHELVHSFFSHIRGRKKRITRAQMRKIANRKRRWFTDNIIMHHKRLHDRNRQIVISSARSRVLAKKLALEKHDDNTDPSRKWRDRIVVKDRAKELRGRIDSRMQRARSRWVSVRATADAA